MEEFNVIKINGDNFDQIIFDQVIVFSFAEAGAMGDGGEVNIIVKNEERIKEIMNFILGEPC